MSNKPSRELNFIERTFATAIGAFIGVLIARWLGFICDCG